MIPKIVHYCWFGGAEKSKEIKSYLETWEKQLPGYVFKEWNESNFDIGQSCDYVKQAYAQKKWAFVSDYVRLHVLYEFGGIYLDTDVEVLKSFDPLLDTKMFIGAESEFSICTATIGAEKNSKFVGDLLSKYRERNFLMSDGSYDLTPNSRYIYEILRDENGYKYSDKVQNYSWCTVYPSDYFSPINCYTMRLKITDNTYSVHHFSETWKGSAGKMKSRVLAFATRIIGEKNREKIKSLVKK